MAVGFGILDYFFWMILLVAFVTEAWAFIDALRRPAGAYFAASKQSKKLWMIITGIAAGVGLIFAAAPLQGVRPIGLLLSILPVAAFIAGAVYLADVRPAIRQYGGGSSRSSGPYGPW